MHGMKTDAPLYYCASIFSRKLQCTLTSDIYAINSQNYSFLSLTTIFHIIFKVGNTQERVYCDLHSNDATVPKFEHEIDMTVRSVRKVYWIPSLHKFIACCRLVRVIYFPFTPN